MKLGFMLLSCWLVGATAGMAQDFAGHYELSSNVGIHRLELQQTGDRLLGTLITANGHRYRLEAQIEGNGATGFLMGDQSREAVELYLEGLQLKVGIYPIDPQSGHIFFDQGQQFAFNRVAGEEAGSMASPSGEVSSEVTLRAGHQYAAGTRVQVPSAGVSFVVPAGWIGGMPRGRPAFLMGSHTYAGVGMVMPYGSYDPEQIRQGLQEPQDLGEGVILMPRGTLRQEGSHTWMEYAGGPYVGHALVVAGPHQNAVLFFFAGPAEQSAYFRQLLQTMAAAVRFDAPRQDQALQQWHQLLAGMMLKKLDSYYSGGFDGSYVGGSSEQTLHLCSDGIFAYFSSSSVAGDAGLVGGYSGGTGGETGRWELQALGDQVLLVLKYNTGQQSQHVVSYDGQRTMLDGSRVYRVQSDRCQ